MTSLRLELGGGLGGAWTNVCRSSARIKLKAVLKTDGFNWRVLVIWFQARSTIDSVSLLTMILNPDRAKDLSDMMNKLVRWDALIRDFAMKLDKNDIPDKMHQAALGRKQVGFSSIKALNNEHGVQL